MRKLLLLLCAVWLLIPAVHASYDDSDGTFYLKTSDGHEEYTVDGSVLFKTYKSKKPSWRDCGVTFMPSSADEVIIATVNSSDLSDGAALLVYTDDIANVKDKIGTSGASTTTYRYMPEGWDAELTGTNGAGNVYMSQDPTGAVSFGFHCQSFEEGKGFTITVQSVKQTDMTFTGSTWTPAETATRGERNALLGTLDISADGSLNALEVNSIEIDASALGEFADNFKLLDASGNELAVAADGRLNFSGNSVLKHGANAFTVTGDLKADFYGTLPAISVTSLNVAGETRTATVNTATTTVANTILMPAEATTFTISDAAAFYDDGGIDGKISENFNGSVTFVPATEGNSIKVEFDKLAIFYNSSAVGVGNQDVFKFYNGRTADESQLITTLTDEAAIVKSTAADGSMTVTLASKTGVPADGWEAIVSEFLPGDMSVETVNAEPGTATGASAYDKDVVLATFNVRASNTLNPLCVENVAVNIQGFDNIAALNVYALGNKNVFSNAKKVGTIIPTADGATAIDLTGATLIEGANYFAVAADISESASNGDELSVSATSATVGGTLFETSTAPRSLAITNSFSHRPGTEIRNIHDVWQFVSTPDPTSSTKYLLGDADCTVTFVPSDGTQAVLEFSTFDVYYASSSYGAKATFEVYSGRTADAANLLWKLQDNAESKTGPGKKLKSAAADGSLTIVFNAKTTSSYYAGTGWQATVTPFRNHNMEIKSVNVTQPENGTVAPGAVAAHILGLDIVTEGTLDSRKLTGVNVVLKDCRSAVTRVSILHIAADGTATEVGSATAGESDEINVPCDATLAEDLNSFVVAFDIDGNVEADSTIDAKLTKISTDSGDVDVADGDPAGSFTAKYEYLLRAGDNGVVTVSRPIHFYDDGGADGNLNQEGLNGTVTFVPAEAGKAIRMTFVKYKTAATGIMNLYSGRQINNSELLGTCKQNSTPELPVVSRAEDGALFVDFQSKNTYSAYEGWDILVEPYTPSALYATAVNGLGIADGQTVRGSNDIALERIEIVVDGDNNQIALTSLDASFSATNLADIKDAKLWYTAAFDGFTTSKQVSSASIDETGKASFIIAEPQLETRLGNYYYWITTSISAEATVGNNIGVTAGTATFSNGTTLETTNSTETPASTTVKAGFAGGEFIIGSSANADYSTFADAIAAMGDGIEGPVMFKVEPGTYAEDIYVNNIKGTSEVNTITFTSQSGNASDVILSGKGFVDGGYSSPKYGIFNVTNTEWVVIDHMTFDEGDSRTTLYPYYVDYVEASRHNTLSNCVMTAPVPDSYSGVSFVHTTCSNPVANGKNADYLTIKDNSFTGGHIALNIQGSNSYVKYDYLHGLTVTGNTFDGNGSKAVYPGQVENLTVSDNIFTAGGTIKRTGYFAIDCMRVRGTVDIYNNRMANSQDFYSGGINMRYNSHGSAERPIRIYNNTISITASPNTSTVGLTIDSDCSYIDVVNNSINIEGVGGHAISVIGRDTSLSGIYIANNAVRNVVSGSGYAFSLVTASLIDRFTFANNAFYSSLGTLTSLGNTTEEWTAATGDATLILEEPKFISATDLHLSEAGSLVAALPVDYVTVDADGTARNAQTPTIGAYEFASLSQDKPQIAEGYPVVSSITHNSAKAKIKWDMSGKLYHKVLKATEEAPAADALKALTGTDATADTEVTLSLTNLEEQTAYKVYFLLDGANGVASDIASADFTTKRYIAPLEVVFADNSEADANEEVQLSAIISGGDEPYGYRWTNRTGTVVGTEEVLVVTANLPEVYTLTVSSADGQSASATTLLKVYGSVADATFEDNILENESYWWGAMDEDDPQIPFYSGAFEFSNFCNSDYQYWGGFAYANCMATDYASLFPGQFHNVVGGGHESATYAVTYTYGMNCNIEILASREGAELSHVYVTNSSYLYNSATVGDSFSPAFAEGDYHKIVFEGDDPEGTYVEFYLADYRTLPGSIVTDWQYVDLKPLGKHVKNIKVSTQSSTSYVPAYAVLDDLCYVNGNSSINAAEITIDGTDIVLARVYALDGSLRMETENPGRCLTGRDLSDLPAGIYIIRYTLADGRNIVRKLAR